MVVLSGAATGFLLLQSFRQTSNARVARAEDRSALACRDIADRYQFLVSGWNDAAIDERFKNELTAIVGTVLAPAAGFEGGFWQADQGSLAYAFPSYEGTGPKTDLPTAELTTIRQVNSETMRSGRPAIVRQAGTSQTLLVYSCPLPGPLQGVTAWTMTRVFISGGPAYNQLLIGLSVLALTVFGSAMLLAWILYSWSKRIREVETSLAVQVDGAADLPKLRRTGSPELDRLVDALNAAGETLASERRRASAAERLAAVGRLAAGLAHEIRNPIAAMRLKSENALAAADISRKDAALGAILQQIGRLDALLRDLLDMTQSREPNTTLVDLEAFLRQAAEDHAELASSKGVSLSFKSPNTSSSPILDPVQMRRALDNLLLNAIQNTPKGGQIVIEAAQRAGNLILCVADDGPGVSTDLQPRLFEPFVTSRAEGTGLGLAIVREIARMHGGDARLAETQKGARFEVEVPWRPS